ncbi:putative GTP-binding protein 6 [Teleopsis dalmanni]|uniref:putative GTP-binding protein 6 n=1 Tax=Teleopsis dalmanni TaxID=139649 RepID=UPI000D32B174|nr:putative GTP-binding protein 6 [Teleopsis dalmanni]
MYKPIMLYLRNSTVRTISDLYTKRTCQKYIQVINVEQKRYKYTQYKGVKGIRSKKSIYIAKENVNFEEVTESNPVESLNLQDREYDEVANVTMNISRNCNAVQNVLILQPYVKWGPNRNKQRTPDEQLEEAEALVRSLPNWNIASSIKVPIESLDKKTLFGSGKIEELKNLVKNARQYNNEQPLTCVFVSKSSLSFVQKRFLTAELNLPIMDRYSVVIQILRLHATSAEARLQVAMAELPYIWAQAKDDNLSISRKQGYSLTDIQRELLKSRERKLKLELESIRHHRKLLRKKRKQNNYPIIAVIGYTNAGKTSLIKALTNEHKMQPRDQLFATLDVTAHSGVLPCNLEVIYMDTVGFMSDIPTGLIECFIATLEDAMLADVIIHVQDLAHNCCKAQAQHVEETLKSLVNNILSDEAERNSLPPIINVGNKIDLVQVPEKLNQNMISVSSTKQTGLHSLLTEIEKQILLSTKRKKITIKVCNGGNEMTWLYKNAAVVRTRADETNVQYLLMDVVIADKAMSQFRRLFCE